MHFLFEKTLFSEEISALVSCQLVYLTFILSHNKNHMAAEFCQNSKSQLLFWQKTLEEFLCIFPGLPISWRILMIYSAEKHKLFFCRQKQIAVEFWSKCFFLLSLKYGLEIVIASPGYGNVTKSIVSFGASTGVKSCRSETATLCQTIFHIFAILQANQ